MKLHGTTKKIETIELEPVSVIRELRLEYVKRINKQGCVMGPYGVSWFDADGTYVGDVYRSQAVIMDALNALESMKWCDETT